MILRVDHGPLTGRNVIRVGEERHRHVAIRKMPLITREEMLADPDPAQLRVRRRLVRHQAGASVGDVTVLGDQLHGGRSEVHRHVLLQSGLVAPEETPVRAVGRRDGQHPGAVLQLVPLGVELHRDLGNPWRGFELLEVDEAGFAARGQADRDIGQTLSPVVDPDDEGTPAQDRPLQAGLYPRRVPFELPEDEQPRRHKQHQQEEDTRHALESFRQKHCAPGPSIGLHRDATPRAGLNPPTRPTPRWCPTDRPSAGLPFPSRPREYCRPVASP